MREKELSSSATKPAENGVRQPMIVLCGPTAAGKSTIAARIAKSTNLRWFTDNVGESPTLLDDRRRSDLKLLRDLESCRQPVIVESSALPSLLPVNNTALIVRLTASTPVRSKRLRARSPELSHAASNRLVEWTDAMIRDQLRSAWSIDIAASRANRWGADLIVGCPEPGGCSDEAACVEIVTILLTAAYNVYVNYVRATPLDRGHVALARFREHCATYFEHVRRCTTALLGPADEFTPVAWQQRHWAELERRARFL